MVPATRYKPGDIARYTTAYLIVSNNGETPGIALWINAGERLPPITAPCIQPPAHYTTTTPPEEA